MFEKMVTLFLLLDYSHAAFRKLNYSNITLFVNLLRSILIVSSVYLITN